MNDEANYVDGADEKKLLAARREIAAACGAYADGFASTAGGVVTGFVAVIELSTPDGKYAFWACGNGDPDTRGALDAWEVEGLLRQALHDLRNGRVSE